MTSILVVCAGALLAASLGSSLAACAGPAIPDEKTAGIEHPSRGVADKAAPDQAPLAPSNAASEFPSEENSPVVARAVDPSTILSWEDIDKLINEQKLNEALDRTSDRLELAKGRSDDGEWKTSLIKITQLRMALHGYETAVRELMEQPWPRDELARATVGLYYASALSTYADAYQWEIRQRERVEAKGKVDLKAWTIDQIFAEVDRTYGRVWNLREKLGAMPVEALKPFIEPNDYPKGVRDTLRDAVSYLRVEHLAQTSGWRPDHESQLFRLDMNALLKAEPAWARSIDLTDPEVHPLSKVAAILGDLEVWHESQGKKEAALEASLERARRIHAASSDADIRALVRKHVREEISKQSSIPWWSMGMAVLAEMERDAGMLVRAHETAKEGLRAHPSSVGGARCLAVHKALEAPDFSIQAMAEDGPGERSVVITHRNIDTLWFRAYAIDIDARIANARNASIIPSDEALVRLLSRKPVAAWRMDLPPTPDLESHRSYSTPPLTKKGLYVIAASATEDFSKKNNRILSTTLLTTNITMVVRKFWDGSNEVTVVDAERGTPVEGAQVSLYRANYGRSISLEVRSSTDRNGVATLRLNRQSYAEYLIVARKGDDVSIHDQGVDFWGSDERKFKTALIYTDRSIYRPLQTLHWKILAYEGHPKNVAYRSLPGAKLTVSLVDTNEEVVEKKVVTTNAYGTASGEFTVPSGRLLGQWFLRTSIGGDQYVRVEEYKRPTFETELLDATGALRLNKAAELKGSARYYFGLPVTNGKVRWTVVRQPLYPWWWWYGHGGGAARAETIASGRSTLDDRGEFKVSFLASAKEPTSKEDRAISYSYLVTAHVTDEAGETRTAMKSFSLGWVSVQARIDLGAEFFVEGRAGEVNVFRSDLNGAPRSGKANWRLVALENPKNAQMPANIPEEEETEPSPEGQPRVRTPGDALRPRWTREFSFERMVANFRDGREVTKGVLDHGQDGQAKAKFDGLAPGAYRLRYETNDDFGEKYEAFQDFIVAGKSTPLSVPAVLRAERTSAKVGESVLVFAHSGFPDQAMSFEIFRGGRRVSRKTIGGTAEGALITLPITKEDRGGFSVALTFVRDHQLVHLEQSLYVPWDDKEMEIEFSSFRDKIRPGAKETWRVTLKTPGGDLALSRAAELLAYMYDASLDVFAPHSAPSVLSVYPSRMGVPWLTVSLDQSGQSWMVNDGFAEIPPFPTLQPDRLLFYDSYGIGGLGIRGYGLGGGGLMRYRDGPMRASEGRLGARAPMGSIASLEADEKSKDKEQPAKEPAPTGVEQSRTEAKARNKAEGAQPDIQLRSNFNETAFWHPHLETDSTGSATIEFEVPDSVTAWNVWVHAVSKDLRGGSKSVRTQSLKELMVRPYVPRFLRESDKATIAVAVDNASDRPLKGKVKLDIVDPETNESLLERFGLDRAKATLPFATEAKKGATVSFSVVAPKQPGLVAFKVTAESEDLSDGELRPVPILPSRMHLSQSRFATLKNVDKKTLAFDDMKKDDDPTRIHQELVVTIDAQLFYSVLGALPYLANYPYECTEQTMNRFVSTGIMMSLYDEYPAVSLMAKRLSERNTPLETWDARDPNRKLALEETPWLVESKGGKEPEFGMVNVLDPRAARAERNAALARLRKAQMNDGSFPWFPGGPPSPYMTLYILHGLSRAAEYEVEVPKDMVVNAWAYLGREFRTDFARRMLKEGCCWEFLTFLNYVASAFPDASWTTSGLTPSERKQILDHSFKHWKNHSPLLKGYLSLTLKRMDRSKDASLVFASVMDSAKTTDDQGTFWAAEDRSWLWYNDTIESHAFALRALMEIEPKDARRHGLVQWLLINKKLGHWKSTKATAEVIYALVKYLEKEGALAIREEITVNVGEDTKKLVFVPDRYSGKNNQLVVAGKDIVPKTMSTVTVEKTTKGFAFASATWHFSTDRLPEEDRGDFFSVSRAYFKRDRTGKETVLRPLAEGEALEVGDEVEVHVSLRTKHAAEYVHLRDPRAAGLEPENAVSRYKWDLGLAWYEEVRDSGANFFFEALPVGEYSFKYRLRANMAGEFRVGPATVQSMYAPEFTAYSRGHRLEIRSAERAEAR